MIILTMLSALDNNVDTCTTLTTNRRENGRVVAINKMEPMTMRWAQIPWPSSHAAMNSLSLLTTTHYTPMSSPILSSLISSLSLDMIRYTRPCSNDVRSCCCWFKATFKSGHGMPGTLCHRSVGLGLIIKCCYFHCIS